MAARVQTAPVNTREIGTRINVVVRVRPPNQREIASAQGNVIHVLDDRVLIFDPPGERVKKPKFMQSSQARAKNLHFGFDKVLAPDCTQDDVFNEVKNTIFSEKGGLLDGFNCTVFAYGATGSGKTFSMAGTPENPGLMSRAVQYIYSALDRMGRKAKLRLSYLEIYNEKIRDLLKPDDNLKELKIVEDNEKGIIVTGLSHSYPTNTDEVLQLIQLGNNRRTQAQTDSNPVSSRSHAVCQIEVENCEDMPDIQSSHPIGKLSLIDLAGSERATTNTGIRLKESAKINCSLLALSNCINALCTQNSFIPFRQSKLTRLLKDSLGGNCKTVCLSCVSPSYMSYDDTYSTLQYANKTKNIRTNVTRNTLNVKAQVSQYPKIIAELRAQILQLQNQGGTNSAANAYAKSIEEPFNKEKQAITNIANKEMPNQNLTDLKQQMQETQKSSISEFKKKLSMKVASFTSESLRKKPAVSSRAIDNEQRIKSLELENSSLMYQIQYIEKLFNIQQNIIQQLSQKKQINVPQIQQADPIEQDLIKQQAPINTETQLQRQIQKQAIVSQNTNPQDELLIHIPPIDTQSHPPPNADEIIDLTEHKCPGKENTDPNKNAILSLLDDDISISKPKAQYQPQRISFAVQNQPLSARRQIDISTSAAEGNKNILQNTSQQPLLNEVNTSQSDNPVSRISKQNDLSQLLRQKFSEVEQNENRKPLGERNIISSGNNPTKAVPYRSLMDQLSQRVAASGLNLGDESSSILLRSRMLTQNGKK